jgi:hypothetical protein
MYKLTHSDTIIRLADNASIPADLSNTDYINYNIWLGEGYTPEAADAVPEPTWQEKRQANIAAGGYGEITEQLEIIGEQGLTAFQTHINAVKAAHPKP